MTIMEDLHEREAARLAELLSLLVRVSGRSRRSLEQELELGSGGLGKILGGAGRLQMSHVLMILAALGVDPGDFFRWVYPFRGRSSDLIENARALGSPPAEAAVTPGTPDSPDAAFDERVRESLLRLLRPRA
ncbi:MAG TPA: hypothetical protein VKM72_23955 [Thermoanaerobaculia bacterium]|nr:hypothetical protein [Thermoanaerobaculia bacterium]